MRHTDICGFYSGETGFYKTGSTLQVTKTFEYQVREAMNKALLSSKPEGY
jgi:hypothetical protein